MLAFPLPYPNHCPVAGGIFWQRGSSRMNDSSLQKKSELQIGGALIAAYKRKGKLTWKLGVYINNEYFGIFVMPLLGINWEIGKKDYLFGVLPGSLTYEHKINVYILLWGKFQGNH